MLVPFKNEPLVDFSIECNRKKMQDALALVQRQLGKEYPLYINGEEIMTESKITSLNPSKISEVVGYISKADKGLAEKAITAANEAFLTWKHVPARMRAEYLFKAAAIIRRRKFEFSAWEIIEEGKSGFASIGFSIV